MLQNNIPELWQHQKDAVPKIANNREFALLMEAGTGKTAATIHGLRSWYTREGAIRSTLIFAPLIVLHNWKKEFLLHSKIKADKILVLDQANIKRCKMFEEMKAKGSGFICITNYEALQMDKLFAKFCNWAPECLICDESHRLKDFKSLRAKKMLMLARHTQRRYLLTGTPILNSPLDIFMQWQILEAGRDGNSTFGTNNFYVFRAKYFEDKNAFMPKDRHFPNWQPRPTTMQKFNELIYQKAVRVLKQDCLDLPPLVRQVIEVSMEGEQLRMYKEMKRDFITYLQTAKENHAVVAQMAMTKALRLQQIVSGYVKTEHGDEIGLATTAREKALKDLLVDLTKAHKVIVWCVFKHNYRQVEKICADLKIEYRSLTGEQSSTEKNISVEDFDKKDDVRVMIANQGAGGIGINLIAASYSVYFSRDFSLEKDIQSEARNYRGGSEIHEKITRIDLVCPGTIDELVLKALAKKQNISDLIMDAERYI